MNANYSGRAPFELELGADRARVPVGALADDRGRAWTRPSGCRSRRSGAWRRRSPGRSSVAPHREGDFRSRRLLRLQVGVGVGRRVPDAERAVQLVHRRRPEAGEPRHAKRAVASWRGTTTPTRGSKNSDGCRVGLARLRELPPVDAHAGLERARAATGRTSPGRRPRRRAGAARVRVVGASTPVRENDASSRSACALRLRSADQHLRAGCLTQPADGRPAPIEWTHCRPSGARPPRTVPVTAENVWR